MVREVDNKWRASLVRTAGDATLVLAATLACWGVALAVEHWARQPVDVVVLAVAITVSAGRVEFDRPTRPWWLLVVVLPLASALASVVGQRMATRDHVGDVAFVVVVAALIAARRFGPLWTRAGTLAVVPFIAALVTPFSPQDGTTRALWSALVGLAAAVSVLACTVGARRRSTVAPVVAAPRPSTRRIGASTRMAVQMGVALALGFVIGRNLHADHWQWPVLTAFIVSSGNQGRGDVVHKSVQRGAGAVVGTVVATVVTGSVGRGDKLAVLLIFVVLWTAVLLRRVDYAYWAACVTAALALVYGYFGDGGISVLEQRLQGIALGALAGVAAAWFVLPVRTSDVLRRRAADVLEAVSGLLAAVRERPAETGPDDLRPLLFAVAAAGRSAQSLSARARLSRRLRTPDGAAALEPALAACAASSRSLVRLARHDPAATGTPGARSAHRMVAQDVGVLRRALRDGPPEAGWPSGGPADGDPFVRELGALDRAVTDLTRVLAAAPSRGGARVRP